MKGYTIEKSIDLLERDVKDLKEHGGGGGGASTWNQLANKPFNTLGEEFHTLSGALTVRELSSDKVKLPDSEAYTWEDVTEAVDGLATEQAAVDEELSHINEELSHINEDIVDLTSNVNSLSTSKQDTLTPGVGISFDNNVISALDVYTTNEEIVGEFLGKPLYQRVVDFGTLPNNSSKTFQVSGLIATSLDTVWLYDGFVKNDSLTNASYIVPLSHSAVQDSSCWVFSIQKDKTEGNELKISCSTGSDRSVWRATIVLRYTKV